MKFEKKNIFYLLLILVYSIDYFMSYYFTKNYVILYESNKFLQQIFSMNIFIVVLCYIFICILIYFVARLLYTIAKHINQSFSDYVVIIFYTTFIILEVYTIIHNIMLILSYI